MKLSIFLNAVIGATAAATKLTPNVVIPLYIYPSAGAWNSFISTISSNPSVTFSVIINPSNGPGAGVKPDSNYIAGIAKLNAFKNVRTLGYVYTSTATRSLNTLASDITTYAKWASYKAADIHMDGIFFDEAPTSYTKVTASYMTTAASKARSSLKSSKVASPYVIFNPGTTPASAFYGIADNIIVFEDSWSNFRSSQLNVVPATYRAKSTIMIHDFSGTSTAEANFVTALRKAGYTGSFITTQSGYEAPSSSLPTFTQYVAKIYSS